MGKVWRQMAAVWGIFLDRKLLQYNVFGGMFDQLSIRVSWIFSSCELSVTLKKEFFWDFLFSLFPVVHCQITIDEDFLQL